MIRAGNTWEWEILTGGGRGETEYYVRRRHLSGAFKSKVEGPFDMGDLLGLLMCLVDEFRPDLLGTDGGMICPATAP